MNHATIATSNRLQRVLAVLLDGKRHTTRAIIRKANVCAVNAIISELRANGVAIECQRTGSVWHYWLEEKLPVAK